MQAIWQLGKGFAGEIAATVEAEPQPAYRTVLTMIRILEQKGFVGHESFNGNNQYYPIVSKEAYSGSMLGSLSRIIEEKRKSTQQNKAVKKETNTNSK